MFTKSAAYYDAIYAALKDYRNEAQSVAMLLKQVRPSCRRVLDVACGTGEHARYLNGAHGFDVDGIDLEPALLRIARGKHPRGNYWQADMVEFDLGRRYDAVISLFSAIAYAGTVPRLRQALACFRRHLAPGGVVLVEPFLRPEDIRAGKSSTLTVDVGGVRVTRSSHSEVIDRLFRLHLDYQFEGPSSVERASEVHDLGLFTLDEMLASFAAAGLAASYQSEGPSGRGLYVAQVPLDAPANDRTP
jgi:ubiquinone/menaquinone biosynthesis C-methylase UbiE